MQTAHNEALQGPVLDVERIRRDFPILATLVNGRPPVFLDNAASSQKPAQVLDAMDRVYRGGYANVHRGVYEWSAQCTDLYDQAREKIARFIGSPEPERIVFTRNATEALNLVAYSYGRAFLNKGDAILVTELEHHANFVPWLCLAQERGLTLKILPITDEGTLNMGALDELLTPDVKLVCFAHVSNVLGSVADAATIIGRAHAIGARVVLDACQSVGHMPLDVRALDCDFLAFSGHKVLGPTGIGALYAKPELLEAMPPFMTGGDMIREVGFDHVTWNDVPLKFEAGTPAFVEAIGLGAALDYLSAIGVERIRAHEHALTAYALERLRAVRGLTVIGPGDAAKRGNLASFTVEGVHPHDLATLLDQQGIAVRAGHHCAQPLHKRLGLAATSRASFAIYNQPSDIDALVDGIEHAVGILTRNRGAHRG
jgi:cysteine desulfurase/selenocysteine lyase